MDKFKALRKMFNDAGVTIYAWKRLNPNMSDAELEYVFNVAEALGCTHTTLELTDDVAQLKRIGAFAEKKKIYAAYHTHLQGSMTAFDRGIRGIEREHGQCRLGPLRRRRAETRGLPREVPRPHRQLPPEGPQTPENGAEEPPWGTGDTPIRRFFRR